MEKGNLKIKLNSIKRNFKYLGSDPDTDWFVGIFIFSFLLILIFIYSIFTFISISESSNVILITKEENKLIDNEALEKLLNKYEDRVGQTIEIKQRERKMADPSI